MARGIELPPEQIETIKAVYAETGRYRAAARAAGCSVSAAKKYATNHDEFEHLRTVKRVDIIDHMTEAQIILIAALTDPAKLDRASLQEIAVAFGIVTDKRQLLSGEATERHEHRDTDSQNILARRLDELAERRRTRPGAPGVRTG